jgi:PAS domain S-box-containing protein
MVTNQLPLSKFKLPDLPLRGSSRGYILAGVCVGLGLALRLTLDPLWHDNLPYLWFFMAELVVMRFAGPGPLAFSALAGLLLGDWCFINPRHSFFLVDRMSQVNSVFFVLFSVSLVIFSKREQRTLERERRGREKLAEALKELARLAAIVESSEDAIVGNDLNGTIVTWNSGAQRLYGYSSTEAIGKDITLLEPVETRDETRQLLARVGRGEPVEHFETVRYTRDSQPVSVSLSISPVRNEAGIIVGASAIARDITERGKAEAERERLVRDLQTALANVKTLRGLLPICASCKKIRDDKGYWNQIEFYIRDRSEASFTHGICPDCSERLYGEVLNSASPRV